MPSHTHALRQLDARVSALTKNLVRHAVHK